MPKSKHTLRAAKGNPAPEYLLKQLVGPEPPRAPPPSELQPQRDRGVLLSKKMFEYAARLTDASLPVKQQRMLSRAIDVVWKAFVGREERHKRMCILGAIDLCARENQDAAHAQGLLSLIYPELAANLPLDLVQSEIDRGAIRAGRPKNGRRGSRFSAMNEIGVVVGLASVADSHWRDDWSEYS